MLKKNIKVFARIKPSEDNVKHSYEVKFQERNNLNPQVLLLHSNIQRNHSSFCQKVSFMFEQVFTETATQDVIYETVAEPVVNSVLEGYNGTIMAYGQTGTGKTHTICGGREGLSKGVIPRAFAQVFNKMAEIKQKTSFKILISIMEIYNEQAFDLLGKTNAHGCIAKVKLFEGPLGKVIIKNLQKIKVSNITELNRLLKLGQSNRSERVGKRQTSDHLLEEAKHINLSLHFIEQVIRALGQKHRTHIPYRNSVVTSFLRDSLGGNSCTAMIFNLSLLPLNFEETLSTCRFAQRVSLVKNQMQKETIQSQSESEVILLKREVADLKRQLELKEESDVTKFDYDKKNEICRKCSNDSGIGIITDSNESENIKQTLSERIKQNRTSNNCREEVKRHSLIVEETLSLEECHCHLLDSMEKNYFANLKVLDRGTQVLNELLKSAEQFKIIYNEKEGNDWKEGSSKRLYRIQGLSLPAKNSLTDLPYSTMERTQYYEFLSDKIDLDNINQMNVIAFGLILDEWKMYQQIHRKLLILENLKADLREMKFHEEMNFEIIRDLQSRIEIKRCKVKAMHYEFEDLRYQRVRFIKNFTQFRKKIINYFHSEWLPHKKETKQKMYKPKKVTEKKADRNERNHHSKTTNCKNIFSSSGPVYKDILDSEGFIVPYSSLSEEKLKTMSPPMADLNISQSLLKSKLNGSQPNKEEPNNKSVYPNNSLKKHLMCISDIKMTGIPDIDNEIESFYKCEL